MNSAGKIFVFELNEFNDSLLRQFSDSGKFPGLTRITNLEKTHTFTKDTYESDYLEPWVQWVSIHTGLESDKHKIKHLGDVPALDHPQIWEALSNKGITSGVWGVLNGSKGNSKNCLFFLPDPWTFGETAYPQELNALLDLPRYAAKNRGKIELRKLLRLTLRALRLFCHFRIILEFVRHLPRVGLHFLRNPKEAYVYFCFVEYLSGLLCLIYRKKCSPDLTILFANSIAHVQHYFWAERCPLTNHRLKYAFFFMDRLATEIFRSLESDGTLFVVNGLSQMNTLKEKPWIAYRPIKHQDLWALLGHKPHRIEPLMSYDCLVFFENAEEKQKAKEKLSSLRIQGKPVLMVEDYDEDPLKLFYRLCFYDELDSDAQFEFEGKGYRFFDYFFRIIQRTGKHIPVGTIYSNFKLGSPRIANQDFFKIIATQYSQSENAPSIS